MPQMFVRKTNYWGAIAHVENSCPSSNIHVTDAHVTSPSQVMQPSIANVPARSREIALSYRHGSHGPWMIGRCQEATTAKYQEVPTRDDLCSLEILREVKPVHPGNDYFKFVKSALYISIWWFL